MATLSSGFAGLLLTSASMFGMGAIGVLNQANAMGREKREREGVGRAASKYSFLTPFRIVQPNPRVRILILLLIGLPRLS